MRVRVRRPIHPAQACRYHLASLRGSRGGRIDPGSGRNVSDDKLRLGNHFPGNRYFRTTSRQNHNRRLVNLFRIEQDQVP
jgi:hypothetical protein